MDDNEVTPQVGELTTINYGWTKPTVGASDDAWGGYVNADLDGIDSTVKSISNVVAALPLAIGDNRIINGDMRIDARNAGVSGTAIGYTCDRWLFGGNLTGKGTWQRNSTTMSGGFPYYLQFTSSSAYTPAAGEVASFIQKIEADMISDFLWGTTSAQTATLSFWTYSSLTGAFGGSLANAANNRSYPFSYSIPTASVWQKTVITIPGDTTGTWVLSGNAAALQVHFDLGSGSGFRGAAGAWASGDLRGVTGAVNVVATNGATFLLTGVKLEIGSVATPYNRQSLTKSLADCQRYFQTSATMAAGYGATGFPAWSNFFFPTVMRAAPTAVFSGQAYSNASALSVNSSTASFLSLQVLVTATGSAWGTGNITLNAEL